MTRPMLAAIAFVLAARVAVADMAPEPVSRSGETLSPKSATNVAMRAEVVTIVLHEDTADITAEFTLRNSSETPEKLEVGFPTAAIPGSCTMTATGVQVDDWRGTTIFDFSAKVDGEPVKTEEKDAVQRENLPDAKSAMRGWVCWPMEFGERAQHIVVVHYTIRTADGRFLARSPLENREAFYILKTGAGWFGPILHAQIVLKFSSAITAEHMDGTSPEPTEKSAAQWTWNFANLEPDFDMAFRYRRYKDAGQAAQILGSAAMSSKQQAVRDTTALAENLADVGMHEDAAREYGWLDGALPDALESSQKGTRFAPPSYWAASELVLAGKPDQAPGWAKKAIVRLESMRARLAKVKWPQKYCNVKPEDIDALIADCRKWEAEEAKTGEPKGK